jgi:hypothetical protein
MKKNSATIQWLVIPVMLVLLSLASCQKNPGAKTTDEATELTSTGKPGMTAGEGVDVLVDGNMLRFTSLTAYDKFAGNEVDRTILKNFADGSEAFKSLQEKKFGIQDELYDLFLDQVLNEDHIVAIGSFLVKLDLENERGFAIDRSTPGAYASLVNNDVSANAIFVFNTEDDGTDVLEKVEAGELDHTNYRAYLDSEGGEASRRCVNCSRDLKKNIEQWDEIAAKSCDKSPLDIYGMDNKVVYQKAIFYFSLQSKIKSLKRCYYGNWIVPVVTKDLHLEGTARFRKRCGDEQTRKMNDYTSGGELNWRPYDGSRSLSHFHFSVKFGIKHDWETNYHNSTQDYTIRCRY